MVESAQGTTEQTVPLGGPVSGPTSPPAGASALERSGDRRGETIDRYLVIDRLGTGGMGDVYLAYDPQLDRRVALKLLRGEGDEDGRLLREAQALAKLAHPNVVGVHDVGVVRGRVFVAMEHVDGETLGQWLGTPRPWRDVVATFVAAGRGLAAAHDVGIIHRDFKPGNVMVGEDGRVRVLDFGLARQLGAAPDALPPSSIEGGTSSPELRMADDMTRTGTVIGTPAFMAPEQFVRKPLTPAADQFAFCVALHAALHGERPFAGNTYEELARAVTGGKVREPSRKGSAPSRVRAAVLRGLAVDPADRWPTMNALLATLENAARPVSTAGIVVVVLAVFMVGAAGLAWIAGREPPCAGGEGRLVGAWDDERRAAVEEAFTATGKPFAADAFAGASEALDHWTADWLVEYEEACAATRVRREQSPELLDLRMACLGDRVASVRALTDLFATADAAVVEHAVEAARKLPQVQPCSDVDALKGTLRPPDDADTARAVADLRVRAAQARALELAGKYVEALPLIEGLLAEAGALGYAPLVAEMRFRHGVSLERVGRVDEARVAYEEAIVVAAEVGHGRIEGQALTGLAGILGYAGTDAAAGLRAVRHAEAVLMRSRDDDLQSAARMTRGNILMRAGRYDEAISELGAAEATLGDGPVHRQLRLAVLVNLAANHAMRGDNELAVAQLEKLAEQIERDLGPHHPTFAAVMMNLGSSESKLGRYRPAFDHLQRARDVWTAASGPGYPDIAKAMSNQANVLKELGDRPGATAMLREAIARKEATPDRDPSSIAYSYNNLCDLLIDFGEFAEALPMCTQARVLLEAAAGPEHPGLVAILTNLGLCELELGRVAESLVLLERANRLRTEAKLSGPDASVGEFALARALMVQGREKARAIEMARRALGRLPGPAHPDHARITAWLEAHG